MSGQDPGPGPVPGSDVSVEPASVVDAELVAAMTALLPQLSTSAPPPAAREVQEIVDSAATLLLVARRAGRIVGALTLVTFRIPTAVRAWIEDVVVDESARRQGVGEALTRESLRLARAAGARTVDLTSRPAREAAGRLYERLGFKIRETRLYRYTFEG